MAWAQDDSIPIEKGGLVKLRNGMVGEIISVQDRGYYARIEVMIDGTRCYVDRRDVKVAGILDRIVHAVADAEEAEASVE